MIFLSFLFTTFASLTFCINCINQKINNTSNSDFSLVEKNKNDAFRYSLDPNNTRYAYLESSKVYCSNYNSVLSLYELFETENGVWATGYSYIPSYDDNFHWESLSDTIYSRGTYLFNNSSLSLVPWQDVPRYRLYGMKYKVDRYAGSCFCIKTIEYSFVTDEEHPLDNMIRRYISFNLYDNTFVDENTSATLYSFEGIYYTFSTNYTENDGFYMNDESYFKNYLQDTFDTAIYQSGYNAGYDYGYNEAENIEGVKNYNVGYDVGYNVGFQQGQSQNAQSYQQGYADGYNEGVNIDTNTATIFAGILEVGLLPVNVFLSIFNFEVFGINIKGLVSALLTIAIVIIIIRFIFGGKKND